MTVNLSETRVSYNGNGVTTVFEYGHKFFADGDLKVYVVEIADTSNYDLLALGADYGVTGAGAAVGGSVDLVVAPAAGFKVVIINDPPAIQPIHYEEADAFPAASHEAGLDRGIKLIQRIQDRLERTVQMSDVSDAATPDIDAILAAAATATAAAAATAADVVTTAGHRTAAEAAAEAAAGIVLSMSAAVLLLAYCPLNYGAAGDGVTDDTAAFNLAFDAARLTRDIATGTYAATVDLAGRRYRTNGSINAGMFRAAYGIVIQNGIILSHATGKIALDCTGSRGLRMNNFVLAGDPVDTPRTGIFFGRYWAGTSAPGASEHILTGVRVVGEFTLTGIDDYSSETWGWYNVMSNNERRSPTAWAIICRGIATPFVQTSDFHDIVDETDSPPLGSESNIVKAAYGCKASRSYPGMTFTVTAIARGATTVITYTGNDPTIGFDLVMADIAGTIELNGVVVTPSAIDTTLKTITLPINSSGYGAYTAGGFGVYATGSALYIAQTQQLSFTNFYAISQGYPPVVIEQHDSGDDIRLLTIIGHFEGIYNSSIEFRCGNNELCINTFTFTEHNSHALRSVFSTNASGVNGKVKLDNAKINLLNFNETPSSIFDLPTKYQFGGNSIIEIGEGGIIAVDELERLLCPPRTVVVRDTHRKIRNFGGEVSPGHIQVLDNCDGLFAPATSANPIVYKSGFLYRVGSVAGPTISLLEGTQNGVVDMAPSAGAVFASHATHIRGPRIYKPSDGAISLGWRANPGGTLSNNCRVFGWQNAVTSVALASTDEVATQNVSDVIAVPNFTDACGIIFDVRGSLGVLGHWWAWSKNASGAVQSLDLGVLPVTNVREFWRIVVNNGGSMYVYRSLDNIQWTLLGTIASAITSILLYAPFGTGVLTTGTTSRTYHIGAIEARGALAA